MLFLLMTGLQLAVALTMSTSEPNPPALSLFPLGERNPVTQEVSWYNETAQTSIISDFTASSTLNRWWAGSIVPWWVAVDGASIWTTIKTPASGESGSGYHWAAVLSCFDYPGLSYDQLGFYSYGSNYYIAWSYSTHDYWGWQTIHSSRGPLLSKNTYYTVEMTVSNDLVTYNVYQSSFRIWTKSIVTLGDWFLMNDYIGSGFYIYPSFTLYEEGLTSPAPSYDLKFQNTQYIRYSPFYYGYWDSWVEYYWEQGYSVPSGVDVTISTSQHYVFIDNP